MHTRTDCIYPFKCWQCCNHAHGSYSFSLLEHLSHNPSHNMVLHTCTNYMPDALPLVLEFPIKPCVPKGACRESPARTPLPRKPSHSPRRPKHLEAREAEAEGDKGRTRTPWRPWHFELRLRPTGRVEAVPAVPTVPPSHSGNSAREPLPEGRAL